jgi:hypothetical protein
VLWLWWLTCHPLEMSAQISRARVQQMERQSGAAVLRGMAQLAHLREESRHHLVLRPARRLLLALRRVCVTGEIQGEIVC